MADVVQTSLFRVPQMLERLMPFCVLVAAMSCYLNLSRRLELVVARSAGVSAWQFLIPAIAARSSIGVLATDDLQSGFGKSAGAGASRTKCSCSATARRCMQDAQGFWFNQATSEGQTIINAASSQRRANCCRA